MTGALNDMWGWWKKRRATRAGNGPADLTPFAQMGPTDTAGGPPTPEQMIAFLHAHRFDEAAYARRYSRLFPLDGDKAVRHFVKHGWKKGRQPSFALHLPDLHRTRMQSGSEPWVRDVVRLTFNGALRGHDVNGDDIGHFVDLLPPSPDHVPAVIIGDSHCDFLLQAEAMLDGGIMPVPMMCRGASARGLGNAQSRAGYGAHIRQRLSLLGLSILHRPVIFKFGQVDVEFLIDLQRIRAGETGYDDARARHFIAESVEKYVAFLIECRPLCAGRMIVMSIFPPALGDAAVRAGYINAHIAFLHADDNPEELKAALAALEHPDQKARTQLARYFNDLLRRHCAMHGIAMIDEFDALLGENGLVLRDIADPANHHLLLKPQHARARITAVAQQIHALALAPGI